MNSTAHDFCFSSAFVVSCCWTVSENAIETHPVWRRSVSPALAMVPQEEDGRAALHGPGAGEEAFILLSQPFPPPSDHVCSGF